jgi:hypothetical protein
MKIVVYTHSDVNWVWKYWYNQTDNYLSDFEKVMFVNSTEDTRKDYELIEYNDDLIYTERVVSCLDKMDDEEVIIFHHEDMFLYDKPNLDILYEFEELVSNDKVHLIKLLRNGDNLYNTPFHKFLYFNPDNLFFAIQPTICKVKTLKEIYSSTPGNTIWEFEKNAMQSSLIFKYVSCFGYNEGLKRGNNHWDNNIYPYIATAVVKGKWNTSEYKLELENILE